MSGEQPQDVKRRVLDQIAIEAATPKQPIDPPGGKYTKGPATDNYTRDDKHKKS
jgi:hypothetical protein